MQIIKPEPLKDASDPFAEPIYLAGEEGYEYPEDYEYEYSKEKTY